MSRSEKAGILDVIEEIAGRDAAAEFSLKHGGRQFHVQIPDRLKDDHPLMDLGREAAFAVATRFCGEVVYVPLARKMLAQYFFGKGWSTKDVAIRLGVSIRSAERYRAQFPTTLVV